MLIKIQKTVKMWIAKKRLRPKYVFLLSLFLFAIKTVFRRPVWSWQVRSFGNVNLECWQFVKIPNGYIKYVSSDFLDL